MAELFDKIRMLQQDVVRNIVKVPSSQEVFADLLENKMDTAEVAEIAISEVMKQEGEFHYTTAIGYPFETDHFMVSRYSDGTFPVWYGSMDKMTTIYETAYHMLKTENTLQEFNRKRVIYDVFCDGMLIDLTQKKKTYPRLITNEYDFTQSIGKQLNQQGYPGLLAPSARYSQGVNVNIFKSEILSQPRMNCELTYRLIPARKKVAVFQKNHMLIEVGLL